MPSLEAPHIETRLGLAMEVDGRWCCLRTTTWGAWSVLAGGCRGPMDAGGLEAVCMVRWFLRLRLVRGVALLEVSDI
jgi:hypothetical protein